MAVRNVLGISNGSNGLFNLEMIDNVLYVNNEVAELFMHPDETIETTRLIYKYENILFKIDVEDTYKKSQCSLEVEKFHKIHEEDKVHFPTLLDWGSFDSGDWVANWVAQEFVKLVQPNRHSDKIKELEEKYNITDIINDNGIERVLEYGCAVNWALKDGRIPFIYDFAF